MTENKAIDEIIKEVCSGCYGSDEEPHRCSTCGFKVAKDALKEIQQYRAIGTVEHIQLTFELCKGLDAMAKMYEAIGTIDEFKALKEKSTPKKAEYKKMVYPSHKWKEENGKIDVWAYEAGYCNGPVCERCYYSFCEHCNPNGYEGECVVEDYICPSCRENVGYKQTHCKCGQKLDWSE